MKKLFVLLMVVLAFGVPSLLASEVDDVQQTVMISDHQVAADAIVGSQDQPGVGIRQGTEYASAADVQTLEPPGDTREVIYNYENSLSAATGNTLLISGTTFLNLESTAIPWRHLT